MMTNYDKLIADRQKDLDEMTPLLFAVKFTEMFETCPLEHLEDVYCVCCKSENAEVDEVVCVGCVKQWLEKEVVQ